MIIFHFCHCRLWVICWGFDREGSGNCDWLLEGSSKEAMMVSDCFDWVLLSPRQHQEPIITEYMWDCHHVSLISCNGLLMSICKYQWNSRLWHCSMSTYRNAPSGWGERVMENKPTLLCLKWNMDATYTLFQNLWIEKQTFKPISPEINISRIGPSTCNVMHVLRGKRKWNNIWEIFHTLKE